MMRASATCIVRALKMKINLTSVAVIALTKEGAALARQIKQSLPASELVLPEKYALPEENNFKKGQFKLTLKRLFTQFECVICVMATGIVVRSIAPYIEDKTVDPAVLVVDEQANHVISLLSGHVGGANEWTHYLAQLINADPVITTATDTENVQALDNLAQLVNGWYPEFKYHTKLINGRLANHEPVNIYIDPDFQAALTDLRGLTKVTSLTDIDDTVPTIIVSDKVGFAKVKNSLQVIPRVNAIGMGCRRNVTYEMVQEAFYQFCKQQQIAWQSVFQIGSVEIKAHENAINYLAETLGIPVTFFKIDELQQVADHYPESAFVKKTVGVGNIANASAELITGELSATTKFALNEVTMALSQKTIK